MNRTELQSLARYLRKHVMLKYPVSVNVVSMPKHSIGDCSLRNKRFYIRIEKTLNTAVAVNTLLHEFAHARIWGFDDDEDHGTAFKEWESRMYGFEEDWRREQKG